MIVGLAGYAGSGKDAAADWFVERGYQRRAFADPLRAIAEAVNPVVGRRRGRLVRYNDAIDRLGYTKAKAKYPLLREFLQRLGTEGGRQILGEDFWVDLTLDAIEDENVVIPDVRFPNEVYGIFSHGGAVLRITRPGVGPLNDHASERSLDDMRLTTVLNDGSLADLHARLQEVASWI